MGFIVSLILIGLIAGGIAKAIMPGKDPGGTLITMLIGIAGSALGAFLGKFVFGSKINFAEFFSIRTWIWAIIGSVILLALYRVFAKRTTS